MSRPKLAVASDIATVVLAVAAVGVAGFRFIPRGSAPAGPARELSAADTRSVLDSRAALGSESPKLTIAVFSDYQCPYCKVADERLMRLLDAHPQDLTLVLRHLPLDQIHPVARMAASAADCANEQGRLEMMHRALFASQSDLPRADREWFEHLADSLSIPDRGRFSTCLGSEASLARIKVDADLAARLGVTGTPAVLLDRTLILGAPDEAGFAAAVENMLDRSR